jgi:hypothetical protein
MAMVQNLKLTNSFHLIGIDAIGNYAQKWITELYNY